MTLSSLAPRVSPLLLRSLGAREDQLGEARTFDAAAALIDVVGFTGRAEELACLGPLAPEALSALVNETFGALVDHIESLGGEILRFPGDAIIALWTADRTNRDSGAICVGSAHPPNKVYAAYNHKEGCYGNRLDLQARGDRPGAAQRVPVGGFL